MTPIRSNARRSLSLLTLAGAASIALGGCAGMKGAHTQKFREEAQQRMAQMKAATEYDMAQQQFLAGDLEKALRSIDRSVSLNDKVARSHTLRGRILIEQGRLEAALAAFEKSAEIDATSAEPRYYKGIVFERFNDFEKAMEEYDAAFKADPSNAQYLLAAVEMLIDQGDLDAAEHRLATSGKDFAHSAGVRQALGHIAAMRGDYETAASLFSEASLLAPDDPALLEDLGRAQLAAGQFAAAEATLRRATATPAMQSRTDLRLLRSSALMQLNKPVEAREILTQVVRSEEGQQDAQAWIDLGNVALVLNDWFNVREAGRRAVSIAPQRAEGYVLSAMHLRHENKPDQALAALEQALRRDATDTSAPKLAAVILAERGENELARAQLEIALERDPKDTQAQRLLAGVSTPAAVAGASTDE